MSDSFYGGKQGISFTLVEHFDSILDMLKAFSQGGAYEKVNYGEFVIIDTIVNLNNKNSLENGLIYCRGYNYDEDYTEVPDKDSFRDDEGNLDKNRYELAMRQYFSKPGAGAVYKGQIVGPQGESPALEVLPESEIIANYNDVYKGSGTLDLVSGDTQNEITYAYCNIRDTNDNIIGCAIGITIPYHIFNFIAKSVSAYSGTYNEETKAWEYSDLIKKTHGNNDEEPFNSKWELQIPKGINGADLINIGVDPDTMQYYNEIRDYTSKEEGIVTKSPIEGVYHKVINKTDYDEETDDFIIHYTHGNDDRIKASWIKEVALNPETYHLLVLYTNPEMRKAAVDAGKAVSFIDKNGIKHDDWWDLGYIRGEYGGIHIIGDLNSIDDLPEGGPSEEYRGWAYTITENDKSLIYVYDYSDNHKGWYSIGSIDSNSIDPISIMIHSQISELNSKIPADSDKDGKLNENGYWFVTKPNNTDASEEETEKVVYLSQKQKDGSYSYPFMPFGVFSSNVEMKNSNTLEEEFKLGGPCITSFETNEEGMIIIEEYRTEDIIEDFYKVITSFTKNEFGDFEIRQTLYMVKDEENQNEIKNKIIVFQNSDNGVVIKEDIE